jgi:hypothetical protein
MEKISAHFCMRGGKFLFQSCLVKHLICGSHIHARVCDPWAVCPIGFSWREDKHFFHPPSTMIRKIPVYLLISLYIDVSPILLWKFQFYPIIWVLLQIEGFLLQ